MGNQSKIWADKYGYDIGYLSMLYKNFEVLDNGYIICGNGEGRNKYEQILDKNFKIKYRVAFYLENTPQVVWNSYGSNKAYRRLNVLRGISDNRQDIVKELFEYDEDNNDPMTVVLFKYTLSGMLDSDIIEVIHAFGDESQWNMSQPGSWLKYDAFLVDNKNCIVPKIGTIYLENNKSSLDAREFYSLKGVSILKCMTDVLNTFSIQTVKVTYDEEVDQEPWSYLYDTDIKIGLDPQIVNKYSIDEMRSKLDSLGQELVRNKSMRDKSIDEYYDEVDSLYHIARQSDKTINFMLRLKSRVTDDDIKCENNSDAAFKFLTNKPLGAATKFVTSDSIHFVTDIQWNNINEVVMSAEPYFVNRIERGVMGLED